MRNTNTATQLLDVAQELVQARGYNARRIIRLLVTEYLDHSEAWLGKTLQGGVMAGRN